MPINQSRILYLVNVDWFFVSHRMPLALAAKAAGAEVWVAAADEGEGDNIRANGLHFIPLPMSRSGTNLLAELRIIWLIFRLYLRIKPQLVHQVAIKPVLYGSIIARLFFPKLPVVNAITGLGFAFSKDKKVSALRPLLKFMYSLALHNPRAITIFQNPDDMQGFIAASLVKPHQCRLIRGSGVDCNIYRPTEAEAAKPMVLLASRMIQDKGIAEFVEAARIVRQGRPDVRFVLAGKPDVGNPNAIPISQLEQWHAEGVVEWMGHHSDMPALIKQSSMVVLPTYYPEGVPKILIEGAACGRPLITTDQAGCREIVKHEVNGLLVPSRNVRALMQAITRLLDNPEMAKQYGEAGRELVAKEFSLEKVIAETMEIYAHLVP